MVAMFLPATPTPQEILAQAPSIAPVIGGARRPFWSVMITSYDSGEYLRRSLQSVLCQDPGPDSMQIEVIDGCSTKGDPESLVRDVGQGRVGFHRLPFNRGAANTFN